MTNDNKKSGVYQIRFGNNKAYWGSAFDLHKRKLAHLNQLRHEYHRNKRIQRNWNKYQIFEFTVLEFCPKENVLEREQIYLDANFGRPHCLNDCPTAGNHAGRKNTDATKKKMSQSAKTSQKAIDARNRRIGIPRSQETRDKLSQVCKTSPKAIAAQKRKIGVPMTDEARQNMSIAQRKSPNMVACHKRQIGVPRSKETRKKISDALKKSPKAKEHLRQIQEARIGVPLSDVTRERLSSANKGKTLSDDHIKNMSIGMTASWARRHATSDDGKKM